jgi:hypothetical protein
LHDAFFDEPGELVHIGCKRRQSRDRATAVGHDDFFADADTGQIGAEARLVISAAQVHQRASPAIIRS